MTLVQHRPFAHSPRRASPRVDTTLRVRYAAGTVRSIVALVSFVAAASCGRRDAPTSPVTTPAEPGASATATASASMQPALSGPHAVLRPAGREPIAVRLELAVTPSQRTRGLMYRRQLDERAGMLFVFPREHHQVFWMHNTYLALDMVFIRANNQVLGVVENATPMTDDPRQVEGDSQYVLELNAGFARRHGITAGTRVEFVDVPDPATVQDD